MSPARAQRLAGGYRQAVPELRGVAADHRNVVAVAADKDMRRAGLAAAARPAPIWLSSCGRNVSTKTGVSPAFSAATRTLSGKLAAVDRAVVDDGEELALPEPCQRGAGRLALASARGPSRKTGQPVLLSAVGQAVGAHADRDRRDVGLLQDRQRRLDRFGAEEADDDLHLGRDKLARGPRAAVGRASVVGDARA